MWKDQILDHEPISSCDNGEQARRVGGCLDMDRPPVEPAVEAEEATAVIRIGPVDRGADPLTLSRSGRTMNAEPSVLEDTVG